MYITTQARELPARRNPSDVPPGSHIPEYHLSPGPRQGPGAIKVDMADGVVVVVQLMNKFYAGISETTFKVTLYIYFKCFD